MEFEFNGSKAEALRERIKKARKEKNHEETEKTGGPVQHEEGRGQARKQSIE